VGLSCTVGREDLLIEDRAGIIMLSCVLHHLFRIPHLVSILHPNLCITRSVMPIFALLQLCHTHQNSPFTSMLPHQSFSSQLVWSKHRAIASRCLSP